jgi:GntP family gluconate:H+ symporter
MHPVLVLLLSIAVVFLGIIRFRVNAFLALIAAALTVGIASPRIPVGEVVPETARIFGTVAGNIGIVIALAALIGQCLMVSGAADRIVRRFVALLGEKRSSLSLLLSGFVLSIPVFFDTVFYLLVPLARAMRVRTGKNYLLFIMAICAGGTVTHCLVPPTPGPFAIATTLGIDLGVMILMGTLLAAPAAVAGWMFSRYMDRRLPIDFRETPGLTIRQLEELAGRDEKDLPGFWVSLTPIVLPVLLIASHTLVQAFGRGTPVAGVTGFVGNPNFALLISAAIALWTLARQKGLGLAKLAGEMDTALSNGGLIILITSAGGAYGGMLVKAGVGEALQGAAQAAGVPLITLAFLIGCLLKIAQGSSTVAMITTASLLAPMMTATPPPYHPVYAAIAIAAGALVGAWMNDSGFWVYKQMTGLTEMEALKTWTPLLAVVGFTSFLGAIAGSILVPLR